MKDNLVKEYISDSFVRLIMAKTRHNVIKPDIDNGVDLIVTKAIELTNGEVKQISQSGKMLNLQLKCTTEKKISIVDGGYKYNLRVKNYNDLVFAKTNPYTKLLLIVFVLPDNEKDWMDIQEDHIKLSKAAFWYYPSDEDTLDRTKFMHKNSNVAITLQNSNRIDLNFSEVFERFHGH